MGVLREAFGRPRDVAMAVLVASAAGLFFALIAPFGGEAHSFQPRLVYCLALAWVDGLPYFIGVRLLMALGRRLGLSVWLAAPLTALIISFPLSLMAWGVRAVVYPHPRQVDPVMFYLEVLCLILPITIIGVAIWRPRQPLPPAATPPGSGQPTLVDRLPPALGEKIVALEAEDHYVRVHTDKGSALLLMRFADALGELGAIAGLRVHRSWWVARAAVKGTSRAGRRVSLSLTNGLTVPVARNLIPAARAAGLLTGYASAALQDA